MPVRIALYVTSVLAALVIGPRSPVYWDSFGYVSQALRGDVGGLALGRPAFVLLSHAIATLFLRAGGSVWHTEPLLRAFWLAVSATAAPLGFELAISARLSPRAARLAGLIIALSPAFAHTAANVLTDGPAAAVLLLALWLAVRATAGPSAAIQRTTALGAGAALGVAFCLREQTAFFALSLAMLSVGAPRTRRLRLGVAMAAGFVLVAGAIVGWVIVTRPGYLHTVSGWVHAMRRERAEHGFHAKDLGAYAGWLAALGPAPLVFALWAWIRREPMLVEFGEPLAAIAAPALLQLALLAGYTDIAYSPRYLLAAFPGAIALPAALAADRVIGERRKRLLVALGLLGLPLVLGAPIVRARERPFHDALADLPGRLFALPDRAVIVTGQPCPAIAMIATEVRIERGRTPGWKTVCPGWGWPADPGATLEQWRAQGYLVVVDLREGAWLGGQRERRDEIGPYVRANAREITVWR